MKQFIKRLFCKHEYKDYWSTLNDAQMRKAQVVVCQCKKCGKLTAYIIEV